MYTRRIEFHKKHVILTISISNFIEINVRRGILEGDTNAHDIKYIH